MNLAKGGLAPILAHSPASCLPNESMSIIQAFFNLSDLGTASLDTDTPRGYS